MHARFRFLVLFLSAMLFGAAPSCAAELDADEFDSGGDLHVTAEENMVHASDMKTTRTIDASSQRTGDFDIPFEVDGTVIYLTEDAAAALAELDEMGFGFQVDEDAPPSFLPPTCRFLKTVDVMYETEFEGSVFPQPARPGRENLFTISNGSATARSGNWVFFGQISGSTIEGRITVDGQPEFAEVTATFSSDRSFQWTETWIYPDHSPDIWHWKGTWTCE